MKDDFYNKFKSKEECIRNGGEWVRPYWRRYKGKWLL